MSQVALSPAVKGLGGWPERWTRRLVLGQLQRLQRGKICLVEGEQRHTFGARRGRSRSGFAGSPSALFPRLGPRGHHWRGRSLHAGMVELRRSAGYVPLGGGQYGVDAAARAGLGAVGRASPHVGPRPQAQYAPGQPAQHRRSLRLEQRLFPPLSRRQHDVFERCIPRARTARWKRRLATRWTASAKSSP